MTEEHRIQISRLRNRGMSYTDIAEVLDLPRSTVKSYFRREKDATEKLYSCEQCGKTIEVSQRPNRRFCSDSCRMRWWNAHPEKKTSIAGSCAYCKRKFEMRRANEKKYCSHACYIADRFGEGAKNGEFIESKSLS